MWEARAVRFPEHTPNTREYFLLRSIFEEHFPSPSALATVPKVPTLSPSAETCKASCLFSAVLLRKEGSLNCRVHAAAHCASVVVGHVPCAKCVYIHAECASGAMTGAEHCMLDAGGLGMGSRVGGHTRDLRPRHARSA